MVTATYDETLPKFHICILEDSCTLIWSKTYVMGIFLPKKPIFSKIVILNIAIVGYLEEYFGEYSNTKVA